MSKEREKKKSGYGTDSARFFCSGLGQDSPIQVFLYLFCPEAPQTEVTHLLAACFCYAGIPFAKSASYFFATIPA